MLMTSSQRTDADRLVAALLAVFMIATLVLASMLGRVVDALWGVIPSLVALSLRFGVRRLPAWLGYTLPLCLCGLAVVQGYLMPGSHLAHASLFVTLCVLVIYEDWICIVGGGCLLLLARWLVPAWWDGGSTGALPSTLLTPALTDSLLMVLLMIALALHARRMQRRTVEQLEMEFLVRAMGQDGPIRLNFDVVRASSPIGGRLKDAQARMASILREVRKVIFSVHDVADEISDTSTQLLGRTVKTNAGLSDAAMSLEQINVIVQESTRASREAREHAQRASKMASQGGEVVQQVVVAMREIASSAHRITDIIGVIDTIAFQTNILALNAAVEAARAGESGRGFAVVAAEVRMLAQRSSEAAREIKSLIGESVSTVRHGTDLADQAGSAMTQLVEAVQRVGSVFESLTEDSLEHAQGIDVITASVRELDAVTKENVHVAERTGEIAAQLLTVAVRVAELLGSFRLGDDEAVEKLLAEAQDALVRMKQKSRETARQGTEALGQAASSGGVDFF